MLLFKILLFPLAAMLELLALMVAWSLSGVFPSTALHISKLATKHLPDAGWYFTKQSTTGKTDKSDQG